VGKLLNTALWRALIILLGAVLLLVILGAAGIVWVVKCSTPSGRALSSLVPAVGLVETQELAASGSLDALDAKLRTEFSHKLAHYRIVTRAKGADHEVVIEPTGWCFCRATYVLHDGGKRLEVVEPLFGNGR